VRGGNEALRSSRRWRALWVAAAYGAPEYVFTELVS